MAERTINRIAENQRSTLRPGAFKAWVLVTGILLSGVLSYFVHDWERAIHQAEFELLASTQASNIKKELERHIDLITSLGGLYQASEQVERGEFRSFVENNISLHSDVQSVFWAPVISRDRLGEAVAAARSEGFAGFGVSELDEQGHLVPATERDWYYPIYYMEPLAPNKRLLGYDIGSHPLIGSDLDRARDTGRLVMAEKVIFNQSSGEQYGAVMIQPVYETGAPRQTVDQRRRNLSGYLLQVFRIGDMVGEALRDSAVYGIDIWLYDEQAAGSPGFLHHHHGDDSPPHTLEVHEGQPWSAQTPYDWTTSVGMTGLSWSLVFTPTSAYLAAHNLWRWWAVLLIGLGLSFVLYFYLRALEGRARKIEELAIGLVQSNESLEKEISSRRAAEEGQHRLSTILEATTDFVCMADKDGRVLFVNQAGRNLVGLGEGEDVSGKHLTDFHPPWAAQRIVNEAIPGVMGGRVWSGETAFLDRNGNEIPTSQVLLAHKSPSGEVDYFSTIARDISERVKVEKQIRDNEASLAQAQRIAHLGNWYWDIIGNTLSWSDEIYRIFGVEPGEFAATYDAFLNAVHPDDRNDVVQAVDAALHERTPYSIDHRIVRPNGEVRIVHEQGEVVFDDAGKPVRMFGTVQDVTEHKLAEAALQHEIRERRNIESAIEEVVEAVSSTTGDEFFRSLVKRLTETLGVEFAFIAQLADKTRDVMETVAVCARGRIVDNFRYSLSGTPCRSVMDKNACFYPQNVQDIFPEDGMLSDMGIQSYLGIPLFNTAGSPLGLVAVLNTAPMENRQPAEAMLHIYAARIAAELQHKKAQEEIYDLVKFPDENPSPVLRVGGDGVLLYANPGSRPILEFLGCRLGDVVPEELGSLCRRAMESGEVEDVDMPCGEVTYSILLAPSCESGYVNLYARDITERLRADAQMRKLSRALEQSADSVMITDPEGVVEYINPAFTEVTGYGRDVIIGHKPDLLNSGHHEEEFYQRLWRTIKRGEVFQDVFINRRKDGSLYYEEKTITPLKDAGGEVTSFVSNGKDITERMQAEERLHRLAYHDVLTELPNRALFQERLDHALKRRYPGGEKLALIFLDLDHFKNINDTLGHDIGDSLLQALPERLAGCVRRGDTIARFGGDEFAILLEDVDTDDSVSHIALKILQSLSDPFVVDTHELFITGSIGIGLYPDDSEDANTLLKHADAAMYRAKDMGRNTYQFYSKDMSVRAFERLSLETSLRHAMEREQFELYYQPQVDMGTGEIIGAEALIRWHHPDMGMVSPMKFIPLLEETGLIVPVGEWILRTACIQASEWQTQGRQSYRVSVNLSGRQFHNEQLSDSVKAALDESGLDPGLLELEITESVLMQHDRTSMANLRALMDMGVRLAIDDFGTGYSSLSYLKRFPVDTLKIDRSFVHDLSDDPDDATIVSAIVVMAHSLNLHVVAEGVETNEQLLFLQQCDCDAIQGYLCSVPLPAEDLTQLLLEGRRVRAISAG